MSQPAKPEKNNHTLLIFRQNLFRASETFIPSQTKNLENYTPLYLGRVQWGEAPKGQKSVSIWPFPRRKPSFKQLKLFLESILSLSPKPWLNCLSPQEQQEIKLIHAHFGPDAVRALPLAEFLKIPLIANFHGFDATLQNWRFLLSPIWFPYAFSKRKLAKKGRIFLCPSHFIRNLVLEMGFPKEKTFVHHIGIDLAKFSLRPPELEENYILHVARLVPGKGTSVLLQAFAKLPERHKGAKLVSIGAGPLRKKLEKLAEDLGLSERVVFLGSCPHDLVKEWTLRSAIAVLPSVQAANKWREGLGLALVEASACGLPVIGSDIGGIPEAMIDGETGFLFPAGDSDALAEKITYLLDHQEIRIKMGKEGRKFVEKEFSQEKQNKKLEKIYDACCRP